MVNPCLWMFSISPTGLRASSASEYSPMRTYLLKRQRSDMNGGFWLAGSSGSGTKCRRPPLLSLLLPPEKKGSSVWVCRLSQVSENNTAHTTVFKRPRLDVLFLIIPFRDRFSPEGHWKRDAVNVLSAVVFLYCSLENDGSRHDFSRCVISYFRQYAKGPECSFNRIFYHYDTRSSFLSVACFRKAHHHSKGRDAFWEASYSSWNFLSCLTCCCTMTSTEIMRLQRKA